MQDPLKAYKEKRDFKKTSEPEGLRKTSGEDIFVIQKHQASHLHYDLRLEVDGVLKSWAVPKGPSLNPQDKRLAIMTEDHPVDYAEFEGVIPEGYGAGTVMVWDKGTYVNLSEDESQPISMDEGLRKGHISFELMGEKLEGAWDMIKAKWGGSEKNWLLIKRKDEDASEKDILKTKPNSAKTGRSLEQILNREK